MSPVEAWEAVKSGKKVERVDACGAVRALRWDDSLGVLAEYRDEWIPDGMPRMAIYREAWQPRVFLGVWEECKTFDEAEPAGGYDGEPFAQYVCFDGIATWLEGKPRGTKGKGYWVRRKPDAGSAGDIEKMDKCIEYWKTKAERLEKRVKLLDGLLDETLDHLRFNARGSAFASNIRARRDGK